jgi:hypothetical protein
VTVAALYVETDGAYFGQDGVDAWDIQRDARTYRGPHPVVAHPPCQRWGRYWHGAPRRPHQYRLGEDDGCFGAALTSVRSYGGVIEHPKDSHAWKFFGLATPPAAGGWVKADKFGGWTCCVWQGHYGHFAGKATWLYAVVPNPAALPALTWGPSDSGPTPEMVARYGYAKARRVGRMALVGGKDKTRIRNATPPAFRAVLLDIARSARPLTSREKLEALLDGRPRPEMSAADFGAPGFDETL